MQRWLKNYLSTFGPQFVRGIGVLAAEAQFERKKFLAATHPLPNFFEATKRFNKSDKLAARLRMAVWASIAIAWMLSITILAFLRLNAAQIIGLILIVSLPAPYILLRIAAWCLPKRPKASRE
jgi:hypothetical protein